jgi:oxygen-dependent protoporphyrinogen oxidase
MIPSARRDYLGSRVVRAPAAYPVFHLDYELDRQRLATSTGVDRLLSIGRNGEFDHILMEDVYWRTVRKARALATELKAAVSVGV